MGLSKPGLYFDSFGKLAFTSIYRTLPWAIILLLWVSIGSSPGWADSPAGEEQISLTPDPPGIEFSQPGELDDFFDDTSSDKEDDFFLDESDTPQIVPASDFTTDPDQKIDSNPGASSSLFFINGSVTGKIGYRFEPSQALPGTTDHQGLSDLTGELGLEMGTRFFEDWTFFMSGSFFYNLAYGINSRDKYTDPFLTEYEKEGELDKIFIRGTLLKKLDIKFGRQIVIWGKSDNIRITDILNPMDLMEPGMTDIEDLRLPVFMSRMDYYLYDYTLSAFLIHEHRFNKLPVLGSPYYYFPFQIPLGEEPSARLENTEIAASLSGTFPGYDISFYLADFYDKMPYVNADLQQIHPRVHMAGFALNMARGNFLLKTEAAFFDKMRLSAYMDKGIFKENMNGYSRLDFLGGIEYSGFTDTMVSIEAADQWLMDFDEPARLGGNNENSFQYALRISRTFLHEVLEITFLGSLYGKSADEGGFIRTQADYDLTDNLELGAGFLFYKSGTLPLLREIGDNDLVFVSLTYSF